MPPRTPKACRVRGCRNTTTDPSGYCESHKSEGWKQYKSGQSRHQRGYGSKWDVIRVRVLQRDKGLCQLCLRAGVAREAKPLTTSSLKHMAALMPTVICRVCAGRVIRRRRPVNGLSDNNSQLSEGRGGSNLCDLTSSDCPPHRFFIPAKNEI